MTNKTLSSLCYFSLLFSPLLIPVIIFLVTEDLEVKRHAKRAFVSHLIPIGILIIGFIIFSMSIFSTENQMLKMMSGDFSFWSASPILFTLLYGFVTALIFIWNIIQGVKSLK